MDKGVYMVSTESWNQLVIVFLNTLYNTIGLRALARLVWKNVV